METATILQLPTSNGAAASGGTAAPAAASVAVQRDRIVIERLVITDSAAATFILGRPEEERVALIERAFRIGLTALEGVGVTVNVDAVRAEFDKLAVQTQLMNERAATTLESMLRANFSDEDGKLPRTLEKFLGDRGALRVLVTDLFDETKRDSAIGRMNELLGKYFDGDASRLALLLDPTRMNSPLHQFRLEVTDGFKQLNEKIVELQASSAARATERAKSAAKGADFEDLLEEMLGDIARGLGDLVERTGTVAGDAIKSKKGDFVLSISPDLTRGQELRVVVEAKDKGMSSREILAELRDAKENRGAAMAVIVFTPAHAPTGIAPFDIRHNDVYCVIDPANPDPAVLAAAIRLARFHAIATLTDDEVEIDTEAIRDALTGIREQLGVIQSMKVALSSISTSTKDVYTKLDTLRDGIVNRIVKAESELNAKR